MKPATRMRPLALLDALGVERVRAMGFSTGGMTLLVQGDRDVFFPVEQIVGLYRSLPDARLWVIPSGEHVPIYEPAVPFVATALRFLSNEEGQ